MPFEPEENIRLAAHGTNVDDLLQAKHMRGYARIDCVCELDIILLVRLDQCSSMDAGCRTECIFPKDGVVGRNWHACGLRHDLTIVLQPGQVLLVPRRDTH